MTFVPLLRQGNFAWCAFPEREAPLRPGPLHVAYVAAGAGHHGAMVADTTSQPWPGSLLVGVLAFTEEETAAFGQARAFVLNLRRLA